MKPLRFCMVTTFYPPYHFGGDGAFIYSLANELAKRDHKVEIIHCLDSYQLLSKKTSSGNYQQHPNVKIHRLESSVGSLSPLATQQTGWPLFKSKKLQAILNQQFDVIHYHNISLVGGPKILAYGQAIKLYTMHEYWLVCQTHALFKFDKELCIKPSCFACSLVHLRPPQWWRYFGLLEEMLKNVDRFISPSQFTADIHYKMGLKIPIVHLPNFVSPSVSLANESQETKELPYFLYVGRLEKIKGLQTIIPIFQKYKKARLLVVGKGNFENELKALGANSPNIEFLGFKSSDELQQLFQQAIALIVPSICYEIFALVIIEAFREKTPVIAHNLGGMPELIEKSGAGFTYNNETELLAAMEQLLTDLDKRNKLGNLGYQAYQENWTPQAHIKQYLTLIQDIANSKNLTLGQS